MNHARRWTVSTRWTWTWFLSWSIRFHHHVTLEFWVSVFTWPRGDRTTSNVSVQGIRSHMVRCGPPVRHRTWAPLSVWSYQEVLPHVTPFYWASESGWSRAELGPCVTDPLWVSAVEWSHKGVRPHLISSSMGIVRVMTRGGVLFLPNVSSLDIAVPLVR